jgi:hypothetical protein
MIEHPGFENERNGFQNNNQKTEWADKMKIKVESEKIIKAVKKLEGIEIVLENLNDAKEAIQLILSRSGLKMLRSPLFKNMKRPPSITR